MPFPGNDELIRLWERNLRQLELQRAQYGSPDVPVHLLNAIEYARQEIRHLKEDAGDLEGIAGTTRPVIVQLAVLQEQVRHLAQEVRSLGSNGRIGRLEQVIYRTNIVLVLVAGGTGLSLLGWFLYALGLLR